MTALRQIGAFIRGEKVFVAFGDIRQGAAGARCALTLALRGYAEVLLAVRERREGEPLASLGDRIECVSADGACDEFRQDRKKSPLGSHRVFTGLMKGDAVCTIVRPHPDQL